MFNTARFAAVDLFEEASSAIDAQPMSKRSDAAKATGTLLTHKFILASFICSYDLRA